MSKEEKPTSSILPFNVNVKTAVDTAGLVANIGANLVLMKDKVIKRAVKPHDGTALIISAGPSLKLHFDRIKELQANGATVVCVKHSLSTLVEAGIVPNYCVMLEARPVDGKSTHGIVRSDLFKDAPKETKYLVASMSSPTLTTLLQDKGLDVTMWHTSISGMEKYPHILQSLPVVQGGTSSATRALFLFHTLGYRKFHVIGFDSSLLPEEVTPEMMSLKTDEGTQKYMQISLKVPMSLLDKEGLKKFQAFSQSFAKDYQVNSSTNFTKPFITTGELAAQLQDLESIYKVLVPHCTIDWYEGGAGKYVWDLVVEQNGTRHLIDGAVETDHPINAFFDAVN